MELGLTGKTALITGAGRGLGKVIAQGLAQEGAEVCLLSRTEHELQAACKELQAQGYTASYRVFDLAQGDAHTLFEDLQAQGQLPDIVIGNAARQSHPKKLTHMPEADWYQTIESDLHGTFRLLRSFLSHQQAQGWGRIILIGSLSGMVGVSAYPAYCTVKAGYEGLIKNLAVDYSKYGITVNMVSPGFIETERFQQAAPAQLLEKFKQATAVKRLAQPEEIAAVVTFLASVQAAYLTGVNLPVCGGLNLGNLW